MVQSYHVDWFITREAVADVTVHISDGKLLGVANGCAKDAIDLGSVALVDGLVNAHTHLEFSGLRSPIPTTGRFTDWIRAVVAYRRQHPDIVGQSIRSGVRECIEAGTTLIGEIATQGWSANDYVESGFRGVVFQEILGISADRIAEQTNLASSHVNHRLFDVSDKCPSSMGFSPCDSVISVSKNGDRNLAPQQLTSGYQTPTEPIPTVQQTLGPRVIPGISPHAPYSTHLDLVVHAVDLSQKTGIPLAMHLAETRAELELLADVAGEFRGMLMEFSMWSDVLFRPGTRPMDYLQLLAKAPRSLIIHGNYLDESELKFLAANPQMTLVYCPRTHAAFGHTQHPWQRAIELGVNVTLGTDSRASNPDLSLFAELQWLASMNPGVSHIELLQLGSIAGRRALGFEAANQANFTLIRSDRQAIQEPRTELFSSTNHVCGIMIDGNWVWLDSHD